MRITEIIHERYVGGRRVRVLGDHLASLLPSGVSVLDVGCGDGQIAGRVLAKRDDVSVRGIDVMVRPHPAIPVDHFDGTSIPHPDAAFDVVMFVDVLHHTEDPIPLLREARRVARSAVVIKDHLLQGPFARVTLKTMDTVGNKRHGVALPYNYLSPTDWRTAFAASGLESGIWLDSLGIYPWPASMLFDRRLHFISLLTV